MFNQQVTDSADSIDLAINWSSGPKSYDPLNFDLTSNITFARMLYSTPFELSRDGHIVSRLFSNFNVSEDGMTLVAELKPQLSYSDGTLITPEDVVFAILRMARFRPQFPVLESIEGLSAWIKSEEFDLRYPSGISLDGRKIKIVFSRPERNVLFRLTLELFAVVPTSCFSKGTWDLICNRPPFSGPYKLDQEVSDSNGFKSYQFSLQSQSDKEHQMPHKIGIHYITSSQSLEFLEKFPNGILHTSDLHESHESLERLGHGSFIAPSARAWFGVLLLSPKSAVFSSAEARKYFSSEFRNSLLAIEQDQSWRVSGSIFTEVLSGFDEKLGRDGEFSNGEGKDFPFKDNTITVRWMNRGIANKDISDSLELTCRKLNLKCELLKPSSSSATDFLQGKVDLILGSTGFWPKDPIGDLKMLFTPNLHADLAPIWSQVEFVEAVSEFYYSTSCDNRNQYREINNLLYEDSIFNVYAHFRYYYIIRNSNPQADRLKWIPQTVTQPYPWQLLE